MVLVYFFMNVGGIVSFLKKQSVRESIAVFLMIPFVFGALALVYMIADGHKLRMDLTVSQRFSLSEQTIQIIRGLDIPVHFLCFFKDGQPGKDVLETGLKQYVYYAEKITYEFVDPDRYPLLAKEHAIEQYGEIIVSSDRGKERLLNATDEESITNAILKATAKQKKVLYFISGHGERDLENGGRDGYSLIKRALINENYDVQVLSLMRSPSIPEDAACLILSAPQIDLFDEEIHILNKYISTENGSLLILSDSEAPATLKELCLKLGVIVGNDIVVDKMGQLFGSSFDTAIVTQYQKHDITKNFTVASFFPSATSLSIDTALTPAYLNAQYLAFSGQGSWAETDVETLKQGKAILDANEKAGPIPVSVVMEARQTSNALGSKCVIFSDSDFVSNTYLKLSGNKDLFMNTVAWLIGDATLISIRPKELDSTPLFLQKSQSTMLFLLPVVVLPLIIVAMGLFVVIQRRKQ
jgi:ABC-type uncharacterized transport system involved in gliding motility auxiliary subunit